MATFPDQFVFLCGAHMDQVMRLDAPAVMGSSNPAQVSFTSGGAALNAAGIASALGLETRLVSPVGNDMFGVQLRETLSERGIGDGLTDSDGSTGIYAAMFNPDGDLAIGAAALSIYDRIDTTWIDAHLADYRNKGCGILVNANLDSDLLVSAINGFTPVAAATISPGKAHRLKAVLARVDILFTNRREGAALLGTTATMDGETMVDALQNKGAKAGVVSDGQHPLYWWQGGESGRIEPSGIADMADVNGAGDALVGATLALLAKGLDFHGAVSQAMTIAAETLRHEGPYPPNAKTRFRRILEGT